MNWNIYLIISAVIGVLIIYLLEWATKRKDFKPTENIGYYALALVITLAVSAFIYHIVTQCLLVIGVGIIFSRIFKAGKKLSQ